MSVALSPPGPVPQPSIIQEHRHSVLEAGPEGRGTGVSLLRDGNAEALDATLHPHFLFLCVCRPKRPSGETIGSAGSAKKQVSPQPRRDARQIYNPPSGKYSATIGNFNYGEEPLFSLYIVLSERHPHSSVCEVTWTAVWLRP